MKPKVLKIILSALLMITLLATIITHQVNAETPRVIEITAKRFAFAPNQVTLKKGEPVILRLKSEDVTHGFFMRKLKIDETVEPGKTVDVAVTPDTPGTYTTICDHFCGVNHGNMNMTISVVE